MEKKGLVVTGLVVGLIGLLSVITGFAAEGTRIKAHEVSIIPPDTCVFPRSPAFGLGVTAALSLLVAHLTISISCRCICCMRGPRPSGSKWIISVVLFVISWITFVIAFIMLLIGIIFNGQHGTSTNTIYGNCYVLRSGIFAGAAVLSLVTLVFGMLYFYLLNYSSHNEARAYTGSGASAPPQVNIAMGHPQFPPPQPPQKTGHQGFVP